MVAKVPIIDEPAIQASSQFVDPLAFGGAVLLLSPFNQLAEERLKLSQILLLLRVPAHDGEVQVGELCARRRRDGPVELRQRSNYLSAQPVRFREAELFAEVLGEGLELLACRLRDGTEKLGHCGLQTRSLQLREIRFPFEPDRVLIRDGLDELDGELLWEALSIQRWSPGPLKAARCLLRLGHRSLFQSGSIAPP